MGSPVDPETRAALAAVLRDLRTLKTTVRLHDKRIDAMSGAAALGASQIERGATAELGPLGANSTTNVAITWPTPFPDSAYIVIPTRVTGAAGISASDCSLASKTPAGCVITVETSVAVGSMFIDVLAVRA